MTLEERLVLRKFGGRIRSLRIKKGLTQQQLAELSELEYKYIQRIEGKNPPSLGLLKLIKIANAFKIAPAGLLEF
jgi:transcriptional regulator with XRE-family HTH domain